MTFSQRAKPQKLRVLKTIVLSALLIVVFLTAAEVGVRAWVYLFRDPAERFDIGSGTFVLRPGEYTASGISIRVNSLGFVGVEFEEPRPHGLKRIIALGDSCTFRPGTVEDPYPARLSRLLNRDHGTPRYQVVNAGIDGLNTELALRRLVTRVIPLKPDIIIVYLGWNDLLKYDPAGQVAQPGLLIVARFIDRAWLVKGLRKLLFHYIRPYFASPATGPGSRSGVFREYRPAVFERNLRSIIATGHAAGARVVVTTLPSVVSDDMTLNDLERAHVSFPYYSSAYAVGDYVDLVAAYNKSIRRIATAAGAQLEDLAHAIEQHPDRRKLFVDGIH